MDDICETTGLPVDRVLDRIVLDAFPEEAVKYLKVPKPTFKSVFKKFFAFPFFICLKNTDSVLRTRAAL